MPIALSAAIAAPSPVRADFADRTPSVPFPHWHPTGPQPVPIFPGWAPPSDDDAADRLAWRNDHESNDDENYPGPEWSGDVYSPDAEDVALYDCVALDEHLGCGCRMDTAQHEAYEADAWLAETLEPDWHEAELARCARFPLAVAGGVFA